MRGVTKDTGTFLDHIKTTGDGEDLKQVLRHCGKHKLKLIRSVAGDVIEHKYKPNKSRRRNLKGNRSEVFTDEMITQMFTTRAICDRMRYTFILQFFLALRPSEVKSVEVYPGYWRMRDGSEFDAVYIWNEKMDRDEHKVCPAFLRRFIEFYHGLWPDSKRWGYGASYIGNEWRKLRDRLGFPWDDMNPKKTRDGRPDYLYSNKSIRHTSHEVFKDVVGDSPFKLAGHMHHKPSSDPRVTSTQEHYYQRNLESWSSEYKKAFLPWYEVIRGEVEELDSLFD